MFGFGKGKINITVQKNNYAPGDTISGNVVLTLKKPVQARDVSISLIGTAWVTTYSGTTTSSGLDITVGGDIGFGSRRSSSSWKEHKRIYDFKQQLDREREYSGGREYPFEMKIPADILSMRPEMTGRIKWYLLAKLDIPRGQDISKKLDVTIG
jgi:sporulation-control protein spo0M